MKIAITGGTAGIGKEIGDLYANKGHDVLRLSRRTGHNIRSVPKVADAIEPCDMFISNAQAGFAQTELLFEIWRRWQGQDKRIIVVSTIMTTLPTSCLPDMDEYWLQKRTLEEACAQLRNKGSRPKITIVRPGAVATQPGQEAPRPYADPVEWASLMVACLDLGGENLEISDFSIGVRPIGL